MNMWPQLCKITTADRMQVSAGKWPCGEHLSSQVNRHIWSPVLFFSITTSNRMTGSLQSQTSRAVAFHLPINKPPAGPHDTTNMSLPEADTELRRGLWGWARGCPVWMAHYSGRLFERLAQGAAPPGQQGWKPAALFSPPASLPITPVLTLLPQCPHWQTLTVAGCHSRGLFNLVRPG